MANPTNHVPTAETQLESSSSGGTESNRGDNVNMVHISIETVLGKVCFYGFSVIDR